MNSILGKASSVASEPYQAYGQPRISPFSQDTNNAFGQVRSGQGAWQPQMQQGAGLVGSAGGPFDSAEFQSYMNPYTDSVVNRIGELAGRNLNENLLPKVNDSFIKSGQFGSRANYDLTGRAIRDSNEAALAEQNRALASGFDSSMNTYQGALDRRLQSGQALGNMAQVGQGLRLSDAAALQGIGQAQEDKTQQSLNLGYNDFLEQRGWPKESVEWLSAISRGINPPTSSSTTTTGTASQSQLAPNVLSQLAGTALGIGGISGWFKKGGKVQAKRPQARGKPKLDLNSGKARGISQFMVAA